jgi:hypothetical protein
MPWLIGVVLAAAVCGLATIAGFDRDRAFYPVITIVIASYYGLFAVMGGSIGALMHESIVITAFLLISVLGFRRNLWYVVVALAGHGLLDSVHGALIADPGVPTWWPPFCLVYDVVTAAYLAALLLGGRASARPRSMPVG